MTSYVGRATELAQARRLLTEGRLLTLTGPGGVGKTRLAVRVMREVADRFADGAVFVGLGEARDASLVPTAVASRLGLHGLSGRPGTDLVVDHLRGRATLLVLDNCEHLLAACAELVGTVLAACPRVVVLATSRQSLGTDGERVLPVPPLEVPDDDGSGPLAELIGYDSLRLFADRARAVLPSFAVTEENRGDVVVLTQRLEGVPLAIELAAARVRSLSPAQIVGRLDRRLPILTSGARTAPHRQQTLRATIDWSYRLCTEAERLVWARMSVFSGSCELDAAEHVCGGDGVDRTTVLDVIDGLLDKSVLSREDHAGTLRFRMLETLREYGHERLEQAGELARVARRHRDWYDTVTARFGAEWLGADQLIWLDRLPRELANIWVALEYCVSTPGEAATAVRMIDRIRPYWTIFGYMNETRRFVARALANLSPDVPEYRLAVWIEGFLGVMRGDVEVATTQLTKARELADAAGDDALVAEIVFSWGIGLFLSDYSTQAVPLLAESLTKYREHDFLEGELNALCFGGFARGFSGDIDGARDWLEQSIARSEESGEIYFQGWAMCALGYTSLEADNLDDAEKFGKQALRFSAETDSWFIAAATVHMLAWTATRRQRFRRAVTLFGASDVIWASIDLQARSFPIWVARLDQYEALTREALSTDAYDRNYARGRAMSPESVISYALDEQPVTAPADRGGLTPREYEIAELVAQGLTNREIAERLVIAKRTADTHIDHILNKLGLANRVQIAAWIAGRQSPG
ncbi:MAG TPA: LuxR C-terminal-related transcriptional regulator [Pseudonocardiaceae bacterium]|jgi:non-specific serine/threonine protein kinase|nr:LuxR C-terminal-related transcriptional regulator [Pseudonocardiaceae bacterium]